MICVGVVLVVSLLTEKPSEAQLAGLTFATLSEQDKADNRNSYNWVDILASLLIVAAIIGILTYFTG